MKRFLFAFVLLLVAADDAVPLRQCGFAEKGQFLTISVGIQDVVDEAFKKKVRSGFAQTIVLRVYLYREGEAQPLGLTLRTYRVWYDLWDERFFVQMQDPQGQRTLPFKTEAEALVAITKLENFPVIPASVVPPGVRHFVAVLVELNPISPEMLAQARRWLSRSGSSASQAGGETFLGSFVSIFVNTKVNEAERIIKFRSQPFYRQAPKP